MTAEWIRFFLIAAVLIAALIAFTGAVLGAWRFGFVMNRLHAAGIGDTLGVLLVIIAAVISAGLSLESLKLVLIAAFLWFTSPVSTHFVGQVEFFTNPEIGRFLRALPPRGGKDGATGAAPAETDGGKDNAAGASPAEADDTKDMRPVEAPADMEDTKPDIEDHDVKPGNEDKGEK